MGGKHSRNKGSRVEREMVALFQDCGLAAEKVSGMYKQGEDISVPFLGVDRAIEVKARANGFAQHYRWLENRFALITKADRQEPLITLRLKDLTENWVLAEKDRA